MTNIKSKKRIFDISLKVSLPVGMIEDAVFDISMTEPVDQDVALTELEYYLNNRGAEILEKR